LYKAVQQRFGSVSVFVSTLVDEAAIFWKKGDRWGRAKLAKYLDFVCAPAKARIQTTFEVAKMEDARAGSLRPLA
jgi:hypothetical protein